MFPHTYYVFDIKRRVSDAMSQLGCPRWSHTYTQLAAQPPRRDPRAGPRQRRVMGRSWRQKRRGTMYLPYHSLTQQQSTSPIHSRDRKLPTTGSGSRDARDSRSRARPELSTRNQIQDPPCRRQEARTRGRAVTPTRHSLGDTDQTPEPCTP